MKPIRIEFQLVFSYLMWAGIAVLLFRGGHAVMAGVWMKGLICLATSALGVWALSTLKPIEADAEGIWQETSKGRREIKWSEVTKAEFVPNIGPFSSGDIVLHSNDTTLAIPGPSVLRPEGRDEMAQFVNSQIDSWNIPREYTLAAYIRRPHGPKIPRDNRRPPISQ